MALGGCAAPAPGLPHSILAASWRRWSVRQLCTHLHQAARRDAAPALEAPASQHGQHWSLPGAGHALPRLPRHTRPQGRQPPLQRNRLPGSVSPLFEVDGDGGGGGGVELATCALHLLLPLVAGRTAAGWRDWHTRRRSMAGAYGGVSRQSREACGGRHQPVLAQLGQRMLGHVAIHIVPQGQVLQGWGQAGGGRAGRQASAVPRRQACPPSPCPSPKARPCLELAAPRDIARHAVRGVVGLEQRQHAADAVLDLW